MQGRLVPESAEALDLEDIFETIGLRKGLEQFAAERSTTRCLDIDNVQAASDRAWKVRSDITTLQETFPRGYTTPPVISFVEGKAQHAQELGNVPESQRSGDPNSRPADVIRNLEAVLPATQDGVYHLVVADRFYTSVQLALQLLQRNVYSIDTITGDKVRYPQEIVEKNRNRPKRVQHELCGWPRLEIALDDRLGLVGQEARSLLANWVKQRDGKLWCVIAICLVLCSRSADEDDDDELLAPLPRYREPTECPDWQIWRNKWENRSKRPHPRCGRDIQNRTAGTGGCKKRKRQDSEEEVEHEQAEDEEEHSGEDEAEGEEPSCSSSANPPREDGGVEKIDWRELAFTVDEDSGNGLIDSKKTARVVKANTSAYSVCTNHARHTMTYQLLQCKSQACRDACPPITCGWRGKFGLDGATLPRLRAVQNFVNFYSKAQLGCNDTYDEILKVVRDMAYSGGNDDSTHLSFTYGKNSEGALSVGDGSDSSLLLMG
ncbi:unnamed protein product [Phytophthora fragariaefolia]|uniref:Unnamed protein product n=1 Tax=Phytophthora fragariaefolia TaxID=1490495 RepID=A0A9W6TKF9_9STRA|nr:unnamed protein product [Phytophthora fragariaefolia]